MALDYTSFGFGNNYGVIPLSNLEKALEPDAEERKRDMSAEDVASPQFESDSTPVNYTNIASLDYFFHKNPKLVVHTDTLYNISVVNAVLLKRLIGTDTVNYALPGFIIKGWMSHALDRGLQEVEVAGYSFSTGTGENATVTDHEDRHQSVLDEERNLTLDKLRDPDSYGMPMYS